MNDLDEFVKKLLSEALSENNWFTTSLPVVKSVSDKRKRAKTDVDYGFEWLVNTALGRHTLENQEALQISQVTVGQKCRDGLKPDLSFIRDDRLVVVEMKTVSSAQVSWLEKDVKKGYAASTVVYLLAVSYPPKTTRQPDLSGAEPTHHAPLKHGFHYFLYRKSG